MLVSLRWSLAFAIVLLGFGWELGVPRCCILVFERRDDPTALLVKQRQLVDVMAKLEGQTEQASLTWLRHVDVVCVWKRACRIVKLHIPSTTEHVKA